MLIQDELIVGAQFGIGLAGNGKPRMRHVVGRDDADDSRHLFRRISLHRLDPGVGMGAAQGLDDQAVLRRDVLRIHRLARNQADGVFLHNRLIDCFHSCTAFPLACK